MFDVNFSRLSYKAAVAESALTYDLSTSIVDAKWFRFCVLKADGPQMAVVPVEAGAHNGYWNIGFLGSCLAMWV